jgi:hypothetical protein
MKTLMLMLLLVPGAFAQTIKGHALGETVSEFQAREPEARKWEHGGKTEISPGHIAFEVTGWGYKPFPANKTPMSCDLAVFENGKLVRLHVMLNLDVRYPDALMFENWLRQLQQKFGPPTDHGDVVLQDERGAEFHTHYAVWEKPDFFAELGEEIAGETARVVFMTPNERKRDLERKKKLTPKL